MFERFTEKSIKAIMLGQEEAQRSGHNYFGVEQLFLGLISLGDGVAFKSLKKFDVTLDLARAEVFKIVPNGNDIMDPDNPFPFTPRCKRVLELSWNEAGQLRNNYIGTEHLLLGLLREGESVAAIALQKLGVDLAALRHAVLEELFEWSKQKAASDSDDMHAFGYSGHLLVLLHRFSEANEYFAKALQLPGGEFYKAEAEACREGLRDMEGS